MTVATLLGGSVRLGSVRKLRRTPKPAGSGRVPGRRVSPADPFPGIVRFEATLDLRHALLEFLVTMNLDRQINVLQIDFAGRHDRARR
jgi:hypothetical protein